MQIMLIEDDESIRDMLNDLLEEEGYQVVSAQHGQQALAYLREQRPLPNLVLLDATMPVMNGWEFLAARSNEPELAAIPVIMLSAAATGAEQRAAQFKVQLVRKPIDIEQLLAIVAQKSCP
jgi:CheY-like chemotaxis protein